MEQFRPILPAEASAGTSGSGDTTRRRRRVVEKPALIACLECRRTRVKCNGNPPETCDRCRMRNYTCEYPPHTKLQKDDILQELAQTKMWNQGLEQRNSDLTTILDVMARHSSRQEIQQRLLAGDDANTIVSWLSTLPNAITGPQRPSGSDESIENAINNIIQLQQVSLSSPPDQRPRWTSVTTNAAFLEHLIILYLHNTEADLLLFRSESFMQNYQQNDTETCSPALLNAVCAMGCNFLVTESFTTVDHANLNFIQSAFTKEAQSLINLSESQNLAAIQAMTVLYLVHLGNARARVASAWLKTAAEHLRSLEAEIEINADIDLSRWCVHSLTTLWSAYSFQNPCSPQTFYNVIEFDNESNLASLYHHNPESSTRRRGQLITSLDSIHAAAFRARLCQLSNSVFRMYCGANGSIGAEAITRIQSDLLALLEKAPACLKQADAMTTEPSIQGLYILYYGVAVSLWSPLVSYSQMQRKEGIFRDFRDLLLESARNAFKFVAAMLERSTKDFLPQNLIYVVNICDSVARWTHSKEERQHVLHSCLRFLSSNTSSPQLCRTLMKMFLAEVIKFGDEAMVFELQASFEMAGTCSVEEALDATTRLTYVTPFPAMIHWLDPDFASQWSSLTRRRQSLVEERRTIRIGDIVN